MMNSRDVLLEQFKKQLAHIYNKRFTVIQMQSDSVLDIFSKDIWFLPLSLQCHFFLWFISNSVKLP